LKILIYSHSFAPNIGGVETYAMLLANGLTQKAGVHSVDVTLVTQTPKDKFNDGEMPFAVVRRPGLARLVRIIRHSDVVHLAGPVMAPLLLSILLRKPVVIEHHGYQASCPNGLLLFQPSETACPDHFMRHEYFKCLQCNTSESGLFNSARMFLMMWPRRWLCHHASVNLCITRHVARRLQLPHSTVVYYGVPSAGENAVVPGGSTRQIAGQSARPTTLSVAFVGRLVREKDVPTLVEAVRMAQLGGCPIALKVIGDGPDRNRVEATIANGRFAPPVVVTGYLRGESLQEALRDVAVVVIPTMIEETAGLAVMEQMSRGRAVIVSDIGGLAEVAGDSGLKFPPGSAAMLAQCLRKLFEEPELLAELGLRARSRSAAFFTLEHMIEEHQRIFEGLVSKAARG
jgi:glycosyltransferase involved in cell wall biosynthesis